jgi:hypothetical protein
MCLYSVQGRVARACKAISPAFMVSRLPPEQKHRHQGCARQELARPMSFDPGEIYHDHDRLAPAICTGTTGARVGLNRVARENSVR